MRPGVVLASGGLDSTVLAYMLAKQGKLRGLFFVNYGQASAREQLRTLTKVAADLNTTLEECCVTLPAYMLGTGAIMGTAPRQPEPVQEEKLSALGDKAFSEWRTNVFDYLEGRNLVFLTMASAYALHVGVDTVYAGFQLETHEWQRCLRNRSFGDTGWDTSAAFVDAFNEVAWHSFSKGVGVVAPFLDKQTIKADIVKLGRKLKVPIEDTYSCEFYPPCGDCLACRRRAKAL